MLLWIATTATFTALMYRGWRGDRARFTPGPASDGHYQIVDDCGQCHTPFAGVRQDACSRCHGEDLGRSDDSHPPAKFLDPRNAHRIGAIDARLCITCHVEHRPAFTGAMAVTQPRDYCSFCHDDIAQERPSHEGMPFATCTDGGCHNFHDNRALTADFLRDHADEPALKATPRLPARKPAPTTRPPPPDGGTRATARVLADWARSAHGGAGVNCTGCHQPEGRTWIERPDHDVCRRCHDTEVVGFLGGRHGMRLAADMTPMTPARARRPMRADAAHLELGCSSCHGAHRYDTAAAAVDACARCHTDRHTTAYASSAHAGAGVTCATCHMPRITAGGSVTVEHNQNDNLRPNEKMLRSVCSHCHGVAFALDALADRALIDRNFAGRPARHVPSIDMVSPAQ